MRHAIAILALGILAFVGGCANTRWGSIFKSDANRANTPSGQATTAQLVDYLNQNSGLVQTMRVEELDITASQNSQPIGLRGQMMTQKPRDFRMSADSFGNRIVDVGSNSQEFWYWISKAQPPYQVFCSYKDLEEGHVRQMPFPFQPEWIMETMGIGTYGPPEKYQREDNADTFRLAEHTRSPQGQPIRKVIVMRKNSVKPPVAQITDYLLLDDASGEEICSAHIADTQLDPSSNAVLPRHIELRWPAEKMKLALKMDGLKVNPPQGLPQSAFVRTPLQGVQTFDLARMAVVDPVQRTQGIGP